MSNYIYKPLDTHSFNSNDENGNDDIDTAPLLKLTSYPQDNNSNDSDSILLNLDMSNIEQIKLNISSRNIIRLFLMTIIVVSVLLSILIIGDIDYCNTDYDKILYGVYGNILFKYYYIINICSYIIFLLFSLYLIIYIILCYGVCIPVRDSAFFKLLKINLGIFSMNIFTKLIYCVCLILLTNNDLETTITKMPKYYNYIIIESISYFIIQLINLMFINKIDNFII
jgi:hypothetical protein